MAKKKVVAEAVEQPVVHTQVRGDLVDIDRLALYAQNHINVMLEGDHGVGKTAIAMEAFRRAGMKVKYFSASSTDPFVDFCGIPKVNEKTGRIEVVRPAWFDQGYDAILLDEFNRAPVRIKNATMEALQFKTMNGEPLSTVKVIWTCINPYGSNIHQYEVDPIDAAQKDRFCVYVPVPFKVSEEYFEDAYGVNGVRACEWWNQIPDETRKLVSPRRLEYALQVWNIGGSLRDVLPEGSNPGKLASVLTKGSIMPTLKQAIKSRDMARLRTIVQDGNNYDAVKQVFQDDDAAKLLVSCMNNEQLGTFFEEDTVRMADIIAQDESARAAFRDFQEATSQQDGETYSAFRNRIIESVPKFDMSMLPTKRTPVLLYNGKETKIDPVTEAVAELVIQSDSKDWKKAMEKAASTLDPKFKADDKAILMLKAQLLAIGQKWHENEMRVMQVEDLVMSACNLLITKMMETEKKSLDDCIKEVFTDERLHNFWAKVYLNKLLDKVWQ